MTLILLAEEAQKLYVRLFSRKLAWLPASRIRYPEIAADLTTCFAELVTAELLDSGILFASYCIVKQTLY